MGNLNDKFEALLRGGVQGATAGWGDEGVASLLGKLPMPTDPEGIPREYAAGSPEQDYQNTERGANAESERRFPGTYHSGKALGAAPLLGVGGVSGIAGAGLVGGARGALAGAGNATEGNRLEGAARLAGPEALMSMAGAAAPQAFGKMKDLLGEAPSAGLSPAYAGAGAGAAEEGRPLVNMASNPYHDERPTVPAPADWSPQQAWDEARQRIAKPLPGGARMPGNDRPTIAEGLGDDVEATIAGKRPLPKAPKAPDLAKENATAEEHAALQEGIDKIKAKNKGTIERTKKVETPLGPSEHKETLRVAPGQVSASSKDEDIRSLLGTMPL